MLLLSFAFMTRFADIEFAWYVPYIICIPLYVALGLSYNNSDDYCLKDISHTVFWTAMIPYFVAMVYSFFLVFLGEGIVNSVFRSISVTARSALAFGLAVLLFCYFRDEAMEIIGNAMILSYLYSMIIALVNIGTKGFSSYFASFMGVISTGYNSWFEMHDLGLSVGFCLMYEIMFSYRRSILRTILLAIVAIICWKRIALAALIVVGTIWFVTRNRHEQFKNFQIGLVMTGVLFFCFAYVMLLSTGALYGIALRYGFDFSNRRFMYSFFDNLYEWKITFLGHGLGSVGKYMTSLVGKAAGAQIQGFRQIHNDILKTYIELGFVGSFLWFFWYTWKFPKVISERIGGGIARYVYCLATVYAFIVYATDNTSEYFIFQTVLYSLILYGCYRETEMYQDESQIYLKEI